MGFLICFGNNLPGAQVPVSYHSIQRSCYCGSFSFRDGTALRFELQLLISEFLDSFSPTGVESLLTFLSVSILILC